MNRTIVLLLFLIFSNIFTFCANEPFPASQKTAVSAESVQQVLTKVEALTGIWRRRPIPVKTMNQAEVRSYINQVMDKETSPAKAQEDERIYKALGLIPRDMDLRQFMLDLYTEQVGGFYDLHHGNYVLADWLDSSLQAPIIAHELTHALQDQHVPLKKIEKAVRKDDDAAMALLAVMEGSATVVMMAYMMDAPVKNVTAIKGLDQLMESSMAGMTAQMPKFAKAPPFLREAFVFPYTAGAEFIRQFLMNHGFAETLQLLRKPPVTTAQVIHPDLFFAGKTRPTSPPVFTSAEKSQLNRPSTQKRQMGEFLLRQFLRLGLPREAADTAAAGWDGDCLLLTKGAAGNEGAAWKIRFLETALAHRLMETLNNWHPPENSPDIQIVKNQDRTVTILVGTNTSENTRR